MATVLAIDIETYSDINLSDNGVYKYTDTPNFEILLFAYAFDNDPVQIVDLAQGEKLPEKVLQALLDKNVIKTAFNAQFERVCINKYFGIQTENWECTMIKAWSLGITGGLENVGKAIGLKPDMQKLMTGKNLIRLFSIPRKVTNPGQISLLKKRTRLFPKDRPKEWEQFKTYCKQDVETERAIRDKLSRFPMPETEKQLYALDQRINDRGIMIDLNMAENAIAIDTEQTDRLTKMFQETTGLENPNSLTDIKTYIKEHVGKVIRSITKDNLDVLKDKLADYPSIVTVLDIRQQLSRTSISKYKKMIDIACHDHRARGLLQFYGASRTSRWAGRLIQVQNLPQNHIKDLDTARKIVKYGDLDLLQMLYDDPADILSQCIRTAIIPAPGKKFIVADFSAIEARIIAWIAGEQWRLDVFKTHGKIYEASASQMFNVPIKEIDKGSPLRQKGKIAELALGYQGSTGALKNMGALKMGLTEDELPELVKQWRVANPKIVQLWYEVESKVMTAIQDRTTVRIKDNLTAIYQNSILFIELPSGRRLAYPKPQVIDHDRFPGKQKIIFQELNSDGQWIETETYGGRLVENIVQATARDCLVHSMLKLDRAGYEIVMHVHDEVVIEIEKNRDELKNVINLMSEDIPWAPGLPMRADGYECEYYQKD